MNTKMTVISFRFSDDILEGCIIKVKLSSEDSISSIISECVKRVLTIFDQIGLENLIAIVKRKHFKIPHTLDEMLSDHEKVYAIENH